jgi:hypothetical protein
MLRIRSACAIGYITDKAENEIKEIGLIADIYIVPGNPYWLYNIFNQWLNR